jgi:GMP synthase-like glutamine amidotransferase
MDKTVKQPISIAILDLYEGVPNEGMRCIRDIVQSYRSKQEKEIISAEFEIRKQHNIPSLDHDIYISSGGPGSPTESEGSSWDNSYMEWISSIEKWNQDPGNKRKKYVFFICHSFQLACRYFKIGNVKKRKSTAFGVFPIHMVENGKNEAVFNGLNDPFYGVDSRDYQVIEVELNKPVNLDFSILCIEKERPHVPLERAVMAIRFNPYMIGTQFHPEADAKGMSMYLQREDKKNTVIENHGYEKWKSMIEHLNDPDKISQTNSLILPNFMRNAISEITNINYQ